MLKDSDATPVSPSHELPSLNLVFDLAQEQLANQLSWVDTLDTKANFVLGSATLLVAGAAALRGATGDARLIVYCVAALAMMLYGVVIFAAYRAYTTREYNRAPDPSNGLEEYIWADTQRTKATVLGEIIEAYSANKKIIANKARWLRRALKAFCVEAVLLAVFAVLQVLH